MSKNQLEKLIKETNEVLKERKNKKDDILEKLKEEVKLLGGFKDNKEGV